MTPEIREARLGKLTASVAAITMGGLKTDGLEKLVKRCAWERVYGDAEEGYKSAAMDRGTELEDEALSWYEFTTDRTIERQVHLTHPTLPFVGATPDGLCRGVRTVQLKCPLHGAWMDVFNDRDVPAEYRWQVRWEMWCASVHDCDFVCYHPKPKGIVVAYSLSDSDVDQMTERAFLVEARVQEWVERLRGEIRRHAA